MSQLATLDGSHELKDRVRRTLARNPYFNGRDLRIEVQQSDVILRGAVKSYYHKQVAQESLRAIDGLGCIRNELDVISA